MSFATNPRQQKRIREREEAAERQRREDFRAVMSTPAGRRFFWDLVNRKCGVLSTTFTGDIHTYHLEGKRAVGVGLMAEAQAICPPEYVTMFREAIEAQAEDEVHRKDALDMANREGDE